MEKQQKHIDDFFKNALGNYTETPPTSSWDAIEKKLNNRPAGANKTSNGFNLVGYKIIFLLAIPVAIIISLPFLKNNTTIKFTNSIFNNKENITTQKNTAKIKTTDYSIQNDSTLNIQTDKIKIAANKLNKSALTDNNKEGNTTIINNEKSEPNKGSKTILNTQSKEIKNNSTSNTVSNNTHVAQNLKNQIDKKPINNNNNNNINKQNNSKIALAKNSKGVITKKGNNLKDVKDVKDVKGNNLKDVISDENNFSTTNNTNSVSTKVSDKLEPNTNFKETTNEFITTTLNKDSIINPTKMDIKELLSENKKPGKDSLKNITKQNILKNIFTLSDSKSPKYETGIKVGGETGFKNVSAQSLVISPYIKYNINKRISVMVQPTLKSSVINNRKIDGTQSYYKVNNDGKYSQTDSLYNYLFPMGNGSQLYCDSSWVSRVYTYSQSHDSITKWYSIGGTLTQFELPLLLNFKITNSIAIFGGATFTYSKLIGINENTSIIRKYVSVNDSSTPAHNGILLRSPKAIDEVIFYRGNTIAEYKTPLYSLSQDNSFRLGFMLGISYEFWDRWQIDGLMQQSSINPNIKGNVNINTALSSTYFRITLGYKLLR